MPTFQGRQTLHLERLMNLHAGLFHCLSLSFTVFHSFKCLCFVSICFVSFLKLSLDVSFCCASRPDCFVFKLQKSLHLGPTHRAKTFVTDKEIWDTSCHVSDVSSLPLKVHPCSSMFIHILRLLLSFTCSSPAVPRHSGVRAFPGYKFTEGKLVMNLCASWAVAEQKQLRLFALQLCQSCVDRGRGSRCWTFLLILLSLCSQDSYVL